MKPKYSEAFIEQAVVKLLSCGDRSVQAVASDLNVNYHTAKYWIKRALLNKAAPAPTKERRPQDWSADKQLVALHASCAESRNPVAILRFLCRACQRTCSRLPFARRPRLLPVAFSERF